MDTCKTVRIKATDPEQGKFVVINESDFDDKKHELFVEEEQSSVSDKSLTVDQIKEQLKTLGIGFPESAKKADLLYLLESAPK